jgi:hypothetical protein
MAQRCGPLHFLEGTWECITDFGYGVNKLVMEIESDNVQLDNYIQVDSTWSWLYSAKGTYTIMESIMTMTYTHLKDPYHPDWIDSTHPDWDSLRYYFPNGETTCTCIMALSIDKNHMFAHPEPPWMQHPGDAIHYEKQ